MTNLIKRMATVSVALILLCVCVVAQNEKSPQTNNGKIDGVLNAISEQVILGPNPCEVYKGEEVNVEVIFPVGYSDLIFSDFTKNLTGTYFTAEICEVDGKVVIKVRGRSDYSDRDVKRESLTVYAIKKNEEYNMRSILSAPNAVLEIVVKSKF